MTDTQPHLVCGPVEVTWNPDDSVKTITYKGQPLSTTIKNEIQSSAQVPPHYKLTYELGQIIRDLFNSIASLPQTEKRKKINLADGIFKHFDKEFESFGPKKSDWFWRAIIRPVWWWEDSHEKVYKGTPYFLMAKTYLQLGDVPSAYICFFNALEEDKNNFSCIQENFKDRPAYLTTSLVNNSNNPLHKEVVVILRAYLQGFIRSYNKRTKSDFTIQDLDKKFLQAVSLEDFKRLFVANFHEIYHLAPLNDSRMIKNDYSKLKVSSTLFNIALIIDQILEYRFFQNAYNGRRDMANAVYQLALDLRWTTEEENLKALKFLKKVHPNLKKGSPDEILHTLLDGTATYDGRPLDFRMRAIFAAYYLRNYAAHHIVGCNILVDEYSDILDMVMDAFFTSVESLQMHQA